MKKIEIDVLRKAFNRIIDKLQQEEVKEIYIDTDGYFLITADEWKEQYPERYEVVTGSLIDDIDEINKLVDEDRFCTYVDFDRVSSILRAISQAQNPLSNN